MQPVYHTFDHCIEDFSARVFCSLATAEAGPWGTRWPSCEDVNRLETDAVNRGDISTILLSTLDMHLGLVWHIESQWRLQCSPCITKISHALWHTQELEGVHAATNARAKIGNQQWARIVPGRRHCACVYPRKVHGNGDTCWSTEQSPLL